MKIQKKEEKLFIESQKQHILQKGALSRMSLEEEASAVSYGMRSGFQKLIELLEHEIEETGKTEFTIIDIESFIDKIANK